MTLLFSAPFGTRLEQQLTLLRDLHRLYDDGAHIHALSIAGRVFVIFEMLKSAEGGTHIQQAGISFGTPINPAGGSGGQVSPLVSKRVYVDDNMTIVSRANIPAFADENSTSEFRCNLGKWLSQPAFYYEPNKFVSRERLVLMMRHKDGGGHPYSVVPPEYVSFAQDAGALSLNVTQAGAPEPTPPIHYASMRQISQELLEALAPSIPR